MAEEERLAGTTKEWDMFWRPQRITSKRKSKEALRSKMKHKALKECNHYTSKYAECSTEHTLSVVWQCRKQAREWNQCLHQFASDAILEEMKREYALKEGKGLA